MFGQRVMWSGGFGKRPSAVALAQRRVEVAALVFEPQEEGHVVHAGDAVVDLLLGEVEVVGQFLHRVLDGVAEADLADLRDAFRDAPRC